MNRPADLSRGQSWSARAATWWRERLDLAPALEFASAKSVPIHRFSWIYLLGGAALFLVAMQVATGCLLMVYYQPTEATAYESVQKIMTEVPYGWLIRSLHVWGAHFFIATVGLHCLSVLLTKSYRRPRELTWVSGVVLLFVALTLGFSGYLLPWNQLSYFATLVGTEIPGSLPGVGDLAVHMLRGGQRVSGDTITRFYAAHVVIMPLILATVLAVHLGLIQLQGMSLPLGMSPARVREHEPFFAEFLLTDICAWLALFGGLVTLALYLPADIGLKADPLQPAPQGIKPEWYFLFVFQLLKYVPEFVGVLAMTAGVLFLFAVPFLDARAARDRRSPGFTTLYLVLIAAAGVLEIKALASPSVAYTPPPLDAKTYHPLADTVCLLFLWLVIGFLVYYLQQLRRHNRRIRLLAAPSQQSPAAPSGLTS